MVVFQVLGPVEVRAAGQQVDIGHLRQRAVLAVLLLQLNYSVPADRLIDRVWGEEPPATARNVLSGYVTRLRAALAQAGESDALRRRDGGYMIRADEDQVDLYQFRRQVAQARAASGDEKAELLRAALGLWRGEPLGGLSSPWLGAMRDTLQQQRTAAVLDLGNLMLANGEHEVLADELVQYAAAYPADERLAGQLMLALIRSGRRGEALQRFEQTRRWLARELGADPGPELQALHQQLLRNGRPVAKSPLAHGDEAARVAARPRQPAGAVPPRQLPAVAADFTGRADELAALDQILGQASDGALGAVVISAIGGMAGVGKTALALHWAHQVAPRFPDGQLHVNLRGFDPADSPVAPAGAIRGFLDALGVPPERVPLTPEAQAGLYRSLLADRKMLVVLDNARDEQQVRPLLPPPGSLVLVTSRRQLAGLAATDGARLLSLDVLSDSEASQLLAARIGANRADSEPQAVSEIASLCGCLPLALAVAAARAAARSRLPLAALADELRDTPGRLDALDAGDPSANVRVVFSWSYQQLAPGPARMFRLLGLHPGPDITAPAAASLAGVRPAQARQDLGELTRAHLITEYLPGRYAFHDLLRAYAADRARAFEDEPERQAAFGRLLDHYLHTAHIAAALISRSRDPIPIRPARPGVTTEHLSGHEQATDWLQAEHQVLLAAVTLAAGTGFDAHAWQIPWAMADFVRRRGHWHEQAAIHETALAAATRLADTAGQAVSRFILAGTCWRLDDPDQAQAHYAASIRLYQQLGDRFGEARVHQHLGIWAGNQGRYTDALGHAEEALRLCRAAGRRAGEAEMLNDVGYCHALMGHYDQARRCCQRSLDLSAELGLRDIESFAWDSLGYVEHQLGNFAQATSCYQNALGISREFGDRRLEAVILTHLGDTRHAAGQLPEAREAWQQALAVFDDLNHPDAGQVRAKLTSTDSQPSSDPTQQG